MEPRREAAGPGQRDVQRGLVRARALPAGQGLRRAEGEFFKIRLNRQFIDDRPDLLF